MRLAYLAAWNSIHAVRWVNAMAGRGHEVHLITMRAGVESLAENVQTHVLRVRSKLGYVFNARQLGSILKELQPDLLHVHYAGGYGTLAWRCGFHPYVLSVWGGDVYDVPRASPLHRWLVRRNLQCADWLCATSRVMAKHTATLLGDAQREITVTPFGVDVTRFRPLSELRRDDTITIGIVKQLDTKYGIDVLLRAFAEARRTLRRQAPEQAEQLRLTIVGKGPLRGELEHLAADLDVMSVTTFTGWVPYSAVPTCLNQFDIFVAPSRLESESFGVAVVEASACGLPVVVSDVGGLPEVVRHGETGIVVESENISALAEAMLRLIRDRELRQGMGDAGRKHVLDQYRWEANVDVMEDVYVRLLRKYGVMVGERKL